MTKIRQRQDPPDKNRHTNKSVAPNGRGLSLAPRGRQRHQVPDDVWEDRTKEVRAMAWAGCSQQEMAAWFDVTLSTFQQWLIRWPPMGEAMALMGRLADDRVVQALYTQALEGNVGAAVFWLKNRRRNEWRDRWDIDVSGEIKTDAMDTRQLALALIATLREGAQQGADLIDVTPNGGGSYEPREAHGRRHHEAADPSRHSRRDNADREASQRRVDGSTEPGAAGSDGDDTDAAGYDDGDAGAAGFTIDW